MTLMLPTPNMSVMQHNLTATPTMTAIGTTITAHATANTKASSWTTLISSTNFDVSMLIVVISNNSLNAAVRNWLVDIGVGAAASEQTLISNLATTSTLSLVNSPSPFQFHLPVYIPRGTRISARGQCSTGSQTANVLISCIGGSSSQPWRTFAGAEAIGVNTGTSASTVITAGSTGAESAWTSVGSVTSRQYYAIVPMVQMATLTTMNQLAYHMEWGYASTTLGERSFVTGNIECVGAMMPHFPDFVTIPTGTQLQVRSECSGTGEALGYALMGLY